MNLSEHTSEQVISDAELRRLVSQSVVRRTGREVKDVTRRPYEYRSSFVIEEVIAVLTDGSSLPLILKDVSPDALLRDARKLRPRAEYHPAREVIVYRDLLAKAELGTAACYAAIEDRAAGRFLLLLEKVSETDLARTGEFTHWAATARWLGTAHARFVSFAQDRSALAVLARYDARCFQAWIERAEQALQAPQLAEGRAVAKWEITWLLEVCRRAAYVVSGLPRTIAHGEFYASNVLVQPHAASVRICPVDWETAGVGSGLIDLAALIAGQWSDEQKRQLTAAYFAAAPPAITSLTHISQESALACCQLLMAMKWAGWSSDWQPPLEHRYDWLAEALELARGLNAALQDIA
jgi:hypothetical protein